jgi:hypothetical protein
MRRQVTGDDRDHGEIDDIKAELAALDDEWEDSADSDPEDPD